MPDLFLLLLFLLLWSYYIIFLLKILTGLNKLKRRGNNRINEFVSVIIPFRNESENILNSLDSIEKQSYSKDKFEVIYVNDSSSDDSLSKLCSAGKSPNVKVISAGNDNFIAAHKKRAISLGIENARGEIIVTTDADCIHGRDWLETLVGFYERETGFISGPVEFKSSGDIFSRIQRTEFAGLIIAGAGLIGSGTPVICNGANASYRKSAYEAVSGFDNLYNLSSGDDELLMQKISRQGKYKVKFCADKKAAVITFPSKTIKDFYCQRKRWASKSLFYGNKWLIIKLLLIFLFYSGIIVQLFLGIFHHPGYLTAFFISFGSKILIEYFILKKGQDLISNESILKSFILTELLHIPYIIITSISGLTGNFLWKNREIKR